MPGIYPLWSSWDLRVSAFHHWWGGGGWGWGFPAGLSGISAAPSGLYFWVPTCLAEPRLSSDCVFLSSLCCLPLALLPLLLATAWPVFDTHILCFLLVS